ncbi:MAG: hypothetical protein V7K43_16640 [Nostoc sp.]
MGQHRFLSNVTLAPLKLLLIFVDDCLAGASGMGHGALGIVDASPQSLIPNP